MAYVFSCMPVNHTGANTLTDGSVLWEVSTINEGERIASSESQEAAEALVVALNNCVSAWAAVDPSDRVPA